MPLLPRQRPRALAVDSASYLYNIIQRWGGTGNYVNGRMCVDVIELQTVYARRGCLRAFGTK